MHRRGLVIALCLAGAAIAAATVVMLTNGAPRLAGPAPVAPDVSLTGLDPEARLCQAEENLYEGTGSIELGLATAGQPGPPVEVVVSEGDRTVARGARPGGWVPGSVRVPLVDVPAETRSGVEVCLVNRGDVEVGVLGEPTDPSVAATTDGNPEGGRMSLRSYLPGEPSLLEVAPDVLERYGRGNAGWLGAWTWLLIGGLVIVAVGAAGAGLLRSSGEPAGRVPVAGRWCALAGLAAALAWALLIPPFHVPDEISHVSYVQGLVETGQLPEWRQDEEPYSKHQQHLLATLRFYDVIGDPSAKPPWTGAEEAELRAAEERPFSRASTNANTASANPPLYYLLQAPFYAATPSRSLLDQLLPMRILSSLLGAFTVLAVFLFVREVLPRRPWAWTVGALGVGLQPLFGFMTSGVNADALLFLCSALTFLAVARVLRRGFTLRRAAALGAVVAAGALTKPLFLALVPAAAAAALVAAIRTRSSHGTRPAAVALAVAAGVALLPVLAFKFGSGLLQSSSQAIGVGAAAEAVSGHSLAREASFIWQLFLPRAPWMTDLLPDVPLLDVWLAGFIGRFGWLDYTFADWVLTAGRWILAVVAALAAAALVARRDRLRSRWLEAGCYLLALAGVLGAIGVQHYNASQAPDAPGFTQARYLLPLLPLYALMVALAVLAWGRRAGPWAAVAVGAAAAVHTIAAMLLTVERYYL